MAVIGVASVADRGVDGWIQDQRSSQSDAVARGFRNGGQPEVVFGVAGGIVVAGVVSGRPSLRRSGVRVLSSVVVAGVTTAVFKRGMGRLRPSETTDPYVFKPFTQHDAFPSWQARRSASLPRRSWRAAGVCSASALRYS